MSDQYPTTEGVPPHLIALAATEASRTREPVGPILDRLLAARAQRAAAPSKRLEAAEARALAKQQTANKN